MIGDRAYDSDPLDQRIHERYGVQLIAPHKFVRVATATQDGRVLRRYRRRWKVERLFAWLHNFRRTVIRWEYYGSGQGADAGAAGADDGKDERSAGGEEESFVEKGGRQGSKDRKADIGDSPRLLLLESPMCLHYASCFAGALQSG